MKQRLILLASAISFSFGLTSTAWADNVALCEILLTDNVETEDGSGTAQIASYRPAVNFLASLYDEEDGHMTHVGAHPIRAVLCERQHVIPAETDYDIISTGIPFVLSQDFDSAETDSLTLIWKEAVLDYIYKGKPLSDQAQGELDVRIVEFNALGLNGETSKTDITAEDETLTVEAVNIETIEVETEAFVTEGLETEGLETTLDLPENLEETITNEIDLSNISSLETSFTDTAPILEGTE